MTTETQNTSRTMIVEGAISLILLALAFLAIAASDISAGNSHNYWVGLVVIYGIASFIFDRLHTGHKWTDWRSMVTIVIHWAGVLATIQLVHMFVAAGRIDNANIGLADGLLLALGTFTSGAAGNWRMIVIGIALGLATAVVAMVEQYLWVLLGVAVVTVLIVILGSRFRANRRAGMDA
ncbi:MAG: hypothetical protein KDA73_08620 [Rhodobacteraceae bacterium]|nr:hypothetical protein [Paracoccaceae bacterium]